MPPMRSVPIAVCSLLAMSICLRAADYELKSVTILPMESYPARVSVGAVTIAADPYPTDEKSFTAFDVKDLNTRGYHPVHIIVQNSSPDYVTIRTRNIVLITSSGQELYTTPATVLVDDIFRGGLLSKFPKMKSRDKSTSTEYGSPLYDFTGKEFTNRQVEPGAISQGFLFFFQTENSNLFMGSKILLPNVVDETNQKNLGPLTIPLGQGLNPAMSQ